LTTQGPLHTDSLKAIADWLVDGARSASTSDEVLRELCDRMVALGFPLWRVAVLVRTLHPQVTGRRFLWRAETGEVSVGSLTYQMMETPEFLQSPVTRVYATLAPFRRRLLDEGATEGFELLEKLRNEGVTDYLAAPLHFTDGSLHVATFSTRAPGGFTETHLAGLVELLAPFARVAEIRALRRTSNNLLNTYVGMHTGERIMAGQIRRGHTETIRAVIWLSDMRGFTSLADRLLPSTLIELLNRYFDCQVPAIHTHGGEVLKFMGDGLLALFKLTDSDDGDRAVCDAALAAADEARANVTALASTVATEGIDVLRFGLALHPGEVLYGNIGSDDRLDFTCIGPAVNLAARLEKLAGGIGCSMIASDAFVERVGLQRFVPLGEFALPGFQAPKTVYGLVDEVGANASAN